MGLAQRLKIRAIPDATPLEVLPLTKVGSITSSLKENVLRFRIWHMRSRLWLYEQTTRTKAEKTLVCGQEGGGER